MRGMPNLGWSFSKRVRCLMVLKNPSAPGLLVGGAVTCNQIEQLNFVTLLRVVLSRQSRLLIAGACFLIGRNSQNIHPL